MKFIIIIITIILLLVITTETIKYSNHSDFFTIINSIFQLNNLPPSLQIYNCFQSTQLPLLLPLLGSIIQKGSQYTQKTILNFPFEYLSLIKSNLSNQTINCIKSSNDFMLILRKYNLLSLQQMQSQFKFYSYKQFKNLNAYFNTFNSLFNKQQYEQLAIQINQAAKIVHNNTSDQQWILKVEHLQKYKDKYWGITSSNGMLGVVSAFQPFKCSQTVMAGTYDVVGRGRVDNLVQTFQGINFKLYFNGDDLSYNYYNYNQIMNFKDGSMSIELSYKQCSVRYTYYTLKSSPFTILIDIEVTSHSILNRQIQVQNNHLSPSYMKNIIKGYEDLVNDKLPIMTSLGKSNSGEITIVMASTYLPQSGYQKNIQYRHIDMDVDFHFHKMKTTIRKGKTFKFTIINVIITNLQNQDPMNTALRIQIKNQLMGVQKLVQKHTEKWQELWTNDIIIKGNDKDQKNMRIMLYHCYAFVNQYFVYGISPMGLSSLGYNGHIFWDMDLWIYPALLVIKPELAKNLIQYRFQKLQMAKNNAYINGYKGAMYPWESTRGGVQQCPVWALPGPEEHHVSGCVANAAWLYYARTRDVQWLAQKGYLIIKGVAQFWESRIDSKPDQQGYYHIRNVVGADQFAENVDDDAFTNAVAIKSLQIANKAAKILNLPQNEHWDTLSKKIIILKFPNNVTREHSTYKGEQIKQADVNLLAYPLKYYSDKENIIRDLQYYQNKIPTKGTPAMTYSIFTLLYSRLLNKQQAQKYFRISFQNNLKPPFNTFSQNQYSDNPYFLTGAGGVLQSVVFGFAGYDITDEGLVRIQTIKPSNWTDVEIVGIKI